MKQIKYLKLSMFVCLLVWGSYFFLPKDSYGQVPYQTNPTFIVASSTTFTLTNTSQRLLATSTPTRRLAATIQPAICTSASQIIYLNMNRDVAATSQNGLAVYASTTAALADYFTPPFVVQGSVQGIAGAGASCTVLVTEWRSQF